MANISRRDFLKFIGAGGIGAGAGYIYAESVKKTVEFLVPQVIPPEDWSPGVATWYNSLCGQCPAGCGISVRIREGRAKKIEGNPVHPVNQGRLCALGQSGLNALYNPDRIRTPLRLTGARGSGEYEPIDWDEAMTSLGGRLGSMKIQGAADRIHLLTGTVRGHLDLLLARFMEQLGAPTYLQYDYTHPHSLYAANRMVFGVDRLPYYDIRNSDLLLSFGADYLGMWISPVHHSLSYGHLRQGRPGHRGTCVQIEPRMSLSGASADRWIPAPPGTEGLLALAIAEALVDGGGYDGADRADWSAALRPFKASKLAPTIGVDAAVVAELTDAIRRAEHPLAIGGGPAAEGSHGTAAMTAVNVLNHLAGSLGRRGGVLFGADPVVADDWRVRQASYARMMEHAQIMGRGDVDVLLLHGTNPVFNLPQASGYTAALDKVGTIVALSSFMDDTTAMADLILPTNVYLESWGDDVPEPGVGLPLATLSQPVVTRIHDSRSAGDIVLGLAHQIGGELPAELPWTTMEEYIRHSWRQIYSVEAGGTDAGFDEFWKDALRSGVWARNRAEMEAAPTVSPAVLAQAGSAASEFDGAENDYPFVLQPMMTQGFVDGRGANLPWQQELPDPLTSVVFSTWVELNPTTAAELDLEEGDVVEVSSSAGTLAAPVFIYQAIRPDVVAIPIGQGHTRFGRFAEGRGTNPLDLVATVTDESSGALATAATRVTIRKTGERLSLIKTDGVSRDLGRQILGPAKEHA